MQLGYQTQSSSFDYSQEKIDFRSYLSALMEAKADINPSNKYGNFVFVSAEYRNLDDFVKLLIEFEVVPIPSKTV